MSKDLIELPIDIAAVKGFMLHEEGAALYRAALTVGALGPCLEIGSYCGKSAVYLGLACQKTGQLLFTIDHHRGSEENQPGWDYHDPDLWDETAGALDTLPFLRRTLRAADLEDSVIPIIGRSSLVARGWAQPIGLAFIDGGHTRAAAEADYRFWSPHIAPGGVLAIHDVFPDPADGGRPPFEIYQMALASGLFAEEEAIASLRLLRRIK